MFAKFITVLLSPSFIKQGERGIHIGLGGKHEGKKPIGRLGLKMDVKDKYWGYTLWIRLIQEKVCREILRTL
jgi:hypothetical protein